MNDKAEGSWDISLADAIGQLRRDISEAVAKSKDQDILFEVGQVEMQFEVAVEREVGGSAGVKFWVVNAEAAASTTRTGTHTLTVPLLPRTAAGGPVLTERD